MKEMLLLLLIILNFLHMSYEAKSCYSYVSRSRRTCTGWWNGDCKNVYYHVRVCCSYYTGGACNIPRCRYGYGSHTCNVQNEGYVRYKDDRIVRNSGGTCIAPRTCSNCNEGYYPVASTDGYCKACYRPPHCNLPVCSNWNDYRCDYCEGEYMRERPGYNVYSGKPDNKECQRACSWKSGARCFPGSCTGDMILATDCQCAKGFESKFNDCATATSVKMPTIKTMFFKLTDTGNELKLVDKALGKNVFWTRQTDWSSISVDASSNYKPEIDGAKIPNYITNYNIGIENLNIGLTLSRGTDFGKWTIDGGCTNFNENCDKESNNTIGSISSWRKILGGGKFLHNDTIKFEVSAKNGGKIYYEDRGTFTRPYKENYYFLRGITTYKVLELGFDTFPPIQCFEQNNNCPHDALKVKDFLNEPDFKAYWDGWSDMLSGIDEYEFNIYYLENSLDDNLLKHKYMLSAKRFSSSKSSAALQLEEPGPYAVELNVHDRAHNFKIARRIIIFDNASVVDLYGEKTRVVQAQETGWINEQSDSIEIIWPNRFRNIRHSNGGWLNGVRENKDVARDLDDREGRSVRTVDKINNIEGIVRFDIARKVEVNGMSTDITFERVPDHFFKLEKMVYTDEEFIDGKKITYSIRGVDAVGEFAEDNVTVMIDQSPPVLQNPRLEKGDWVKFRVHGNHKRMEVIIEWDAFDYHSGIHEVSWKLFDNVTEAVHGEFHVYPQDARKCQKSYSKYVRESDCYCTPYYGCFNQHFHVKIRVSKETFIRLLKGMDSEKHDSVSFIEITVTNNAGLTTVRQKRATLEK